MKEGDDGGDYEKGMTERENINSARGLLATTEKKGDEQVFNTLGVKLNDPTEAKTDHLELR